MKKLLATLLASTMAFSAVAGLAACGGGEGGGGGQTFNELAKDLPTVADANNPFKNDTDTTPVAACELTVWAPDKTVAAFEEYCKTFTSDSYLGGKYKDVKIKFVAQGEDKSQEKLATDPEQGADVFFFPSDHLSKFIEDDILQELAGEVGAQYTSAIVARDSEASYKPAIGERGYMMAFPATADNGYFLWYDSDYFSADDVKTLDGMMNKAKKDNKNIIWGYNTAWYSPAFFFGMGCTADYVGNEYVATFNDENGKIAGEAMIKYLYTDNVMENGKQCLIDGSIGDDIVAGMKAGSVVAGIGGNWFANELPASAKATKLPTFTANVNGKDVQKQMYTFFGGKYCGVNSKRENQGVSMALANFLTNYDGQVVRFKADQGGPSNKTAAALPEVVADQGLAALTAQANAQGTYFQGRQDPFWDAMPAFMPALADGTITSENLQEKLDDLVATLRANG